MRDEAKRSSLEAFAKPVAARVGANIWGLLRELSGEMAYQRYVDGRRRRCFPESSIMTRGEYERWRSDLQEQRPPEARC